MAISIIQKDSNWNASGTVSVALAGVTAGSTLIALGLTHNDTTWDVSSNNGGAFTQDATYQPNTYVTRVFRLSNCNSGAHTVTLNNGSTNSILHVWEIGGLSNSSPLDQTATENPTTSSSPDIGPTGTTTQADELVIGIISAGLIDPATYTAGGSFGSNFEVSPVDTTFNRQSATEAKVVSATGTYSADYTAGAAVDHEGIVVTYKMAAGAGGAGKPHTYYAQMRNQ